MTRRVRLCAVPSLCARPLTIAIGADDPHFDLVLDDAHGCARRLLDGTVDLALLPSARYALLDLDLRLVPGIATSVCGPMLPELAAEHDLGPLPEAVEKWRARTGLPFVSLVWAGRPAAVDHGIAVALAGKRDQGLQRLGDVVAGYGESHDAARYVDCLSGSMNFQLGSQELSGLASFVDQLRSGPGSRRRVRLFDFAYGDPSVASESRPMTKPERAHPTIDSLLADGAAGRRLTPEEGLRLQQEALLFDLGQAADQRRRGLHPGGVVTYIIDRNVNYTNLCVTACKFCNFYRPVRKGMSVSSGTPGERRNDGYTLSRAELAQKFQETVDLGGIQILLQGGVNPDLRLSYYEDLFRWTKAHFPLALHALSPEEVSFIAKLEGLSIRRVLERLVDAGLDSLPGGGAEILDDEIRRRISPLKCSTDTWLAVMREAHALGLRTTSTMVFGFGETPGHIIAHLERLRALQDGTAGFTAFICWPFQAEGTRLKLADDTTAQRYLRTFSLARLYLDNVPNLQVSWPTMGPAIGQVALRFGGNDFGSAMIEENVVSQAGAVFKLSAADIERCVIEAGFTPRRRNMRYELLSTGTAVTPGLATRPPAAA